MLFILTALNHAIHDLSVIPIETLHTDNLFHRRQREYYWQLRLGTIYPKGLNGYPVNNKELTTQSEKSKNDSVLDSELLDNLMYLLNDQ